MNISIKKKFTDFWDTKDFEEIIVETNFIISNLGLIFKFPLKIFFIFSLSIIDGIASSYFSQTLSQIIEYLSIFGNIQTIGGKFLNEKLASISGILVGNLSINIVTENLIDSIAEDMSEDFDSKMKYKAIKQKALVRMTTKNLEIPNLERLKLSYHRFIKNTLLFTSKTVKDIAYLSSFFAFSSIAALSFSTAIYTGVSYAAIWFAISQTIKISSWGLSNYYAKLEKDLNDTKNRITDLENKTISDPLKYKQLKIDKVTNEIIDNWKKELKAEKYKLSYMKIGIDVCRSLIKVFDWASVGVADLYAYSKLESTAAELIAKYMTNEKTAKLNPQHDKITIEIANDALELGQKTAQLTKEVQEAQQKRYFSYSDSNRENIKIENFSLQTANDDILLENVQLDLEFGKSYILEGATGCGKSTFGKVLAECHHLFNGEITLPESFRNSKSVIQFVPKEGMITLPVSLYKYVTSELYIENEEAAKDEIEYLIDKLNLKAFKGKIYDEDVVRNPSSGEQVRILIIKAILSRAKVIIMDEALATLDNKDNDKIQTRKETENLLKDYVTGKYKYNRDISGMILSIQHEFNENFGDVRVEFDKEQKNVKCEDVSKDISSRITQKSTSGLGI